MSIDPAVVDKARNRWDVIAAEVPLKRVGHELIGLCPFHIERSPSFTVCPDKGFFHCFGCGAHGTAIDFMMRRRGLRFADAVTELAGLPPQRERALTVVPRRRAEPAPDPMEAVQAILAESGPVTQGTGAHLYLWSRGLVDRWHPLRATGLLAHPALYCVEIQRALPALIAKITDDGGSVTALQRIWVTERIETVNGIGPEDARAELKIRKKTIGRMRDGAVRLAPVDGILGLAEGIETAVAATRLYRVPVWATCGAARLGSIAVPKSVELIIVFGDNGDAGIAAAEAARETYRRQGIDCDTIFPPAQHQDFNSELLHRSAAA